MKPYLSILVSILLLQSCDKEVVPPPLPPCEHDDFHVSFRFNGSCETQVYVDFSDYGDYYLVKSGRSHSEEILQFLSIGISKESILNDTLWIGTETHTMSRLRSIRYSYQEASGVSGTFSIPPGQGTKDDYLIINYYNADTTILEGRFQCTFKERSVASWVNSPDSLVLTDGSFKVMME